MATKKLQILGSLGGNVEVDSTLAQEGAAADAKAVGDALADKLNVSDKEEIVDDVLADIPVATNVTFAKSDSTITATVTLDDGTTSTSVITLDENERPVKVVTDGVECPVSWEGFE